MTPPNRPHIASQAVQASIRVHQQSAQIARQNNLRAARQHRRVILLAALQQRAQNPPASPVTVETITVDSVLDQGDRLGTWEVQLRWDELSDGTVMLQVLDGENLLESVIGDNRDDALLAVTDLLMPPNNSSD